MADEPSLSPGARVLIALEAFYEIYRSELPDLTYKQLRTLYRRLAFYATEIDDEASRKPPASDTPAAGCNQSTLNDTVAT